MSPSALARVKIHDNAVSPPPALRRSNTLAAAVSRAQNMASPLPLSARLQEASSTAIPSSLPPLPPIATAKPSSNSRAGQALGDASRPAKSSGQLDSTAKLRWRPDVGRAAGQGPADESDSSSDGDSDDDEGGGMTSSIGPDQSDAADEASESCSGSDDGESAPPLSKWELLEQQQQERRVRELMEAFHRSKTLETRFCYSLPNPAEEAERKLRKLNGLTSFRQQVDAPVRPAQEEGLGMASNVSRNAKGSGGTMRVGQLNVVLTDLDLMANGGRRESSGTGPEATATGRHALQPGAGAGLDAAFRRALPRICSPTAFLDDDGAGDEFKVKRTKLRSGLKKPKKVKKKQAQVEGAPVAADGEAEPGGRKKKKKRRRKRRVVIELDPVKALAEHAVLPLVHQEL